MKHIKTFESFSINEEEEIFKDLKKKITGEDKQEKISAYVNDISSGEFKLIEKLKKDIERYKDAKPTQGLGSGSWLSYISNLLKFVREPKVPSGKLEDIYGKELPAIDVIEQEIAVAILKDRLVTKVGNKWKANVKGRNFSSSVHTFGSGE